MRKHKGTWIAVFLIAYIFTGIYSLAKTVHRDSYIEYRVVYAEKRPYNSGVFHRTTGSEWVLEIQNTDTHWPKELTVNTKYGANYKVGDIYREKATIISGHPFYKIMSHIFLGTLLIGFSIGLVWLIWGE